MTPTRPKKLAILGASGKLAFATLTALLTHSLLPPSSIIATTSAPSPSAPQWQKLASLGVEVRHADFDDGSTIERALQDVEALFLVSSPRIALDFDGEREGGRERDHVVALEAARRAGVRHVYYSSLAFGRPSRSGVMRAHIATEEYLENAQGGLDWTVIRQGLYNESWPLYLGHWELGEDEREVVRVAGDGKINWTSIRDLGLANALVLVGDKNQWRDKTCYLSNTRDAMTLEELARLVGAGLGREIKVEVVSRDQHEAFYIEERGMDEGLVRWWSSTYEALGDGECLIKDDTFERLLSSRGVTPKPMEETVQEMLQGGS